jgi:hypothetical protein
VRKLGASHVFDCNRPAVVTGLVNAFRGKAAVGVFDAIGGIIWGPAVEFIQKEEGAKFVATVMPGFPDPPEGIMMKAVFASSIKDNHVGEVIYKDLLPKGLKAGAFVPAPEPLVAGKGLESLHASWDIRQQARSS